MTAELRRFYNITHSSHSAVNDDADGPDSSRPAADHKTPCQRQRTSACGSRKPPAAVAIIAVAAPRRVGLPPRCLSESRRSSTLPGFVLSPRRNGADTIRRPLIVPQGRGLRAVSQTDGNPDSEVSRSQSRCHSSMAVRVERRSTPCNGNTTTGRRPVHRWSCRWIRCRCSRAEPATSGQNNGLAVEPTDARVAKVQREPGIEHAVIACSAVRHVTSWRRNQISPSPMFTGKRCR